MNMHKNKLVACIKSNGKVLREYEDTVRLPFGSEYSIFLKNLNTVRASVKIEIDGKDALDGSSLIINANSELNLERFIKNGNLEKGNRFKFIERNSKVETTRGIGAEDGLIRIQFQFERDWLKEYNETKKSIEHHYHHYPMVGGCFGQGYNTYNQHDNIYGKSWCNYSGDEIKTTAELSTKSAMRGVVGATSGWDAPPIAFASAAANNSAQALLNDAGITAPGSVSEQKFTALSPLSLETETHVIVLKLLGETESGKKIERPITVKSKNKCSICARVNKATAKFCQDCGAGLEIVK